MSEPEDVPTILAFHIGSDYSPMEQGGGAHTSQDIGPRRGAESIIYLLEQVYVPISDAKADNLPSELFCPTTGQGITGQKRTKSRRR
jgi:hypothetical protein